MGWFFTNGTRSELLHELTQSEESPQRKFDVIAHCERGNVLWLVIEITAKQDVVEDAVENGCKDVWRAGESRRHIRCCLLDGSGEQWGYKPLVEADCPCYYTCPLSYLDMAPEACHAWREGVRAYHAHGRSGIAHQIAMNA